MSFDDVMKKMKAQYISDLATKITELEGFVQQKDFKEIESLLHKLKGSGASYGLPEISEYGAKYEQKAKEQTLADEDLSLLVEELKSLYQRFL